MLKTHSVSRPVRWVPRAAGLGVEDLPGPVRQQQVLGQRQRCRPAGRHPRLRRSDRHPPGRARGGRTTPLLRARRDDLRSLALRAGSGAQARRSAQRRAVQGLGAAGGARSGGRKLTGSNDGDRQMVEILAAVLTDGLPAVEAACARRSPRASIPPTSSSTFSPASATRGRRRRS